MTRLSDCLSDHCRNFKKTFFVFLNIYVVFIRLLSFYVVIDRSHYIFSFNNKLARGNVNVNVNVISRMALIRNRVSRRVFTCACHVWVSSIYFKRPKPISFPS